MVILCDGRHGFFPDWFGMGKWTFNQFCMMKPHVLGLCLPQFADCFCSWMENIIPPFHFNRMEYCSCVTTNNPPLQVKLCWVL